MKKNLLWFFLIMGISLYIAYNWESLNLIRNAVGSVLDPSLGGLLNWNIYIGFIIIIAFISLVLTLSQKFLSDQAKLKELKEEQKYLQGEIKKYKDNPEKLMEFQRKQLEIVPKTFDLTLKPAIYTSIPIILLFRWFAGHLQPVFGGWWVLYFIIGSVVFSGVFRKLFKVA